MIDATSHITGKTGVTPTAYISKNGAGFAAVAGSITELSYGWYKLTPTTVDTNTLGPLALHVTGTGCDPVDALYQIVAFDPEDATSLGLSRIDSAIGSVPTNVWAAGTRTLTSISQTVTAVLTTAEHTNVATDVRTGLTAQGYTTTRAPYLDYLDAAVSSRSTFSGTLGTDAITAASVSTAAANKISSNLLGTVVTNPTVAPTTYTVDSILGWLLAITKFKREQTTSTENLYRDDTVTLLATSSKYDSGSVFTRSEYV